MKRTMSALHDFTWKLCLGQASLHSGMMPRGRTTFCRAYDAFVLWFGSVCHTTRSKVARMSHTSYLVYDWLSDWSPCQVSSRRIGHIGAAGLSGMLVFRSTWCGMRWGWVWIIYIYIYIYRERERETYIYIYIYIYIYHSDPTSAHTISGTAENQHARESSRANATNVARRNLARTSVWKPMVTGIWRVRHASALAASRVPHRPEAQCEGIKQIGKRWFCHKAACQNAKKFARGKASKWNRVVRTKTDGTKTRIKQVNAWSEDVNMWPCTWPTYFWDSTVIPEKTSKCMLQGI